MVDVIAVHQTVSDERGEFLFPLLPGGQYVIVPEYRSDVSLYELRPHEHAFEITSSAIDLRSLFHIVGFSVTGSVVAAVDEAAGAAGAAGGAAGIAGVEVGLLLLA